MDTSFYACLNTDAHPTWGYDNCQMNNITDERCNLSRTFWLVYPGAYYAAYYVNMPLFFVFGLCGHILCLMAFRKAAKNDTAFTYPFSVSLSQIGEILFYVLYVFTLKWWSGVERDGSFWFRRNYSFMWYAARLATPLLNMCLTSSLLLSLSMSTDRFFALSRPHSYKNWPHRRNRYVAFGVSLSVGVLTSVFAVYRYKIQRSHDQNDTYLLILDVDYASETMPVILSHFRTLIRMTALIALIVFNVLNLKLFRTRVMKVGDSNISHGYRKKTEAERTLFVLVIVESTLTALGMSSLSAYFVAIFTAPEFAKCTGLLMIPLVDILVSLTNMGKFYVVWALDSRFRRMIYNVIKCRNSLGIILQTATVPPTQREEPSPARQYAQTTSNAIATKSHWRIENISAA